MDLLSNVMLLAICALKLALWRYSDSVAKRSGSSAVSAIAMDNFNDCLSNLCAFIFANLASNGSFFFYQSTYWWCIDPLGAILISLYIISSWVSLGIEQV